MKYLSEFRDPEMVLKYREKLDQLVTKEWTLMEVCGGQTHSLVKNGLLELLPEKVQMIHGPGCPVCVTPLNLIDKAVHLAMEEGVILCSFGDMLRVPGSKMSLLEAKSRGADVRILYSPLEAVQIAKKNPLREVVFFAVGFETTAPANALSVVHAEREKLHNYSILASHVLVPPAMEAVVNDPLAKIDGFLAAGHVCTIMGIHQYAPLVNKHKLPIIVTGFEPLDILQGVYMCLKQLEAGEAKLENQYARVVQPEGNPSAVEVIERIFEISDREWRGIGEIPQSGYVIREKYKAFDANHKFQIMIEKAEENKSCIAGQVLKGIKKPHDCPEFGKNCTPQNPLGAPMVSSEGACAAYYHFSKAMGSIEAQV